MNNEPLRHAPSQWRIDGRAAGVNVIMFRRIIGFHIVVVVKYYDIKAIRIFFHIML